MADDALVYPFYAALRHKKATLDQSFGVFAQIQRKIQQNA
jgi:hypothetical protein